MNGIALNNSDRYGEESLTQHYTMRPAVKALKYTWIFKLLVWSHLCPVRENNCGNCRKEIYDMIINNQINFHDSPNPMRAFREGPCLSEYVSFSFCWSLLARNAFIFIKVWPQYACKKQRWHLYLKFIHVSLSHCLSRSPLHGGIFSICLFPCDKARPNIPLYHRSV